MKLSKAQINEHDDSEALLAQVLAAYEKQQVLSIQGNGSKAFLTHPVKGESLSTSAHQGIINYFPSELTITVRSGTLLSDLQTVLAENGQMLPFEPPAYADNATIGGTIATGLSGPARAFAGSARDYVLGCKIINGRGELLKFGGEVMKNVAGYDLSRLISGSFGGLGVILEVSLKLLPKVEVQTLSFSMSQSQFPAQVQALLLAGFPITAACYVAEEQTENQEEQGQAYIRLSGSSKGVAYSSQEMQQVLEAEYVVEMADASFWLSLNEQQLPFFKQDKPLWRISLPRITLPNIRDDFSSQLLAGDRQLIDWAGALRWLYSDQDADTIRRFASQQGGHAQLYRVNNMSDELSHTLARQQPLTAAMLKVHQQIKRAMDPAGILNPGCIYPDL
ncbi:glycolate oxidase subunit GlcE [sulfur-oxidizing endosymbiont of Gigantopelta aegis]|uniref:glycolate oxidase subunit GlcE n=1 Tax=sulfur-oxidizing endosymbiont of Gigantopelta aegis TaxID=2794934 RepID=UPI0018DCD2D4|nr:glycolate oxidase subunit GlcE [sulfur-oxidizing endosymbiont of Gigantopelta aegis]